MRAKRKTRPSTKPRPAGELLDGTFRWLKLEDSARSFRAMRAFSLVAGARICDHARAERQRGAILYVRCESSAWSQHLHVMKAQLIQRLNTTPGGEGIEELRFNVGPLSDVVAWDAPPPIAPPGAEHVQHQLSAEMTHALGAVDDPELRAHLEKLYARIGARIR